MFLADPEPDAPPLRVPMTMLVPMGLVTAANVYVGLDGEAVVSVATRAAESLLALSFGGGAF